MAEPLHIALPFFQAGLAGYSDAAMRGVARRHGCPYCVTEAMLDQFLIRGGKGLAAAELTEGDHPIAGQLMGSHPADIAAGAKVLLGLGYDTVDINLACPVKKIRKKARGGHLLSVPDEAKAILSAVADAVGGAVPMTVKLRRAYSNDAAAEADLRAILEHAIGVGFAGATVHGRTVEQKYIGPARWSTLRRLAGDYAGVALADGAAGMVVGAWDAQPAGESQPPAARRLGGSLALPGASPTFVLGGSGDIWDAHDVRAMLEQTGVTWVSIARGCIGNPWLFRQAAAVLRGEPVVGPTIHQQRDVLREHFELSVALHGEQSAGRMMRKFGIKFSRHHPDHATIKAAFITVRSLDDWQAVLDRWYATDGPGVPPAEARPEEAPDVPTRVAA
jgi:tRNA-dihydrouridine synthase